MHVDLIPELRRWGLRHIAERYLGIGTLWHLTTTTTTLVVAPPEPERWRQWLRLTVSHPEEMACSSVADCFGWSRHDAPAMRALVDAQRRSCAPGCIKRGRQWMWQWPGCLCEMRIAAALLAHLRSHGQRDLRWLVRDLLTGSP